MQTIFLKMPGVETTVDTYIDCSTPRFWAHNVIQLGELEITEGCVCFGLKLILIMIALFYTLLGIGIDHKRETRYFLIQTATV